ncbi:MAG: TrkH family potassium uptake protein, partial [Clostridiales bacterium]|nr:TrkH family potassium uptake protein [Clostridiales bacterium]
SLIYNEQSVAIAFIKLIIPTILIGIYIIRKIDVKRTKLKIREGFLVVALTWLIASILGAFPYIMTGLIDNFINAFFESTSGFTTTGATLLSNVEILPKGLLFWRSFSQWLGAMGILIFAVSLLPALGISGQRMAKAETPGPTLNKIVPRMSDSAKILYLIYIIFTVLAFLLFLRKVNIFDAILLTFSSVASGGLINYNDGIAHFDSIYIESIVIIFTLLVCVNFTLYYNIVRGNLREFFSDRELRTFIGILITAIILITANLWLTDTYDTLSESIRYSIFQSSSFITTTGHFSTDFNQWPSFSKMILFLLMLIGACSSSTGGGIKVIRIIILFKLIQRGFNKKLHPRAVIPIKLQDRPVPIESVTGITSFLYLYIFIFSLSTVVLSFENIDLLTIFSTVAAILNNVGTGLDIIGPMGSFDGFSAFSKLYLSILMLVGRLELFTIVILFTPSFWNPDR